MQEKHPYSRGYRQPPSKIRLYFRDHPVHIFSDKPYIHDTNIDDPHFRRLGYSMAFLAGMVNVGGFFAVASYSSHITGEFSRAAAALYTGIWDPVITAVIGILSFMFGCYHASGIILRGKAAHLHSAYGLCIWLESCYMLIFATFAFTMDDQLDLKLPVSLIMLAFMMGMHNSVISIMSHNQLRCTHITATVTDLGHELAKLRYYKKELGVVFAPNASRIRLFLMTLTSFFVGGLCGAFTYHKIGYHFTLPVAIILFMIGFHSVKYDILLRYRLWRKRHRQQAKK